MYKKFLTLLQETGKKTSDVAKATGIAESVFSNWKQRSENGACLSLENTAKIAKYFGVPIEYFVDKS